MKIKNPFKKKESVSQKISSAVHMPKHNSSDKYLRVLQQVFLYVAIFMAGYILGMLQSYF